MDEKEPKKQSIAISAENKLETKYNARVDSKVQCHPDKGQIIQRYLLWESMASLAREFKVPLASIDAFSRTSGLRKDRANNSVAILEALVYTGMNGTALKVDASTIVHATKLRAKLTGELKSDNSINVNILIPTQDQFNSRLAEAEAIRGRPLNLAETPKLLPAKRITVDPYPDDDSHLPHEVDFRPEPDKLDGSGKVGWDGEDIEPDDC